MEKVYARTLPFFQTLSTTEKNSFIGHSTILEGEAGKILIEAGALCEMVYFVLEGRLRVYKLSEDGREITLYRASKGEACLFSLTCIMGEDSLETVTVVEKKAKLVGIPVDLFESLMGKNLEFQRYFLRRLLMKISNLVMLTEEITFHSIESRLAKFLLDRWEQEGTETLSLTHEKMAFEIGSAREVVSRMLKIFQNQGLIELSRGKVTLLSPEKLKNFLTL